MRKSIKDKLLLLLAISILSISLTGCSKYSIENSNENVENKEDEEVSDVDMSKPISERKVIRVGTPGQNFPWNFFEDGKLVGIDVEVLEEACDRIGYEVEFDIIAFEGLYGAIDSGQADTGAWRLTITQERLENYDFSEEYSYSPFHLVVRADDDEIKSVDDLIGKRFIADPKSVSYQFIMEYIEENNLEGQIEVIASEAEPFMEIELGRADATFDSIVLFEDKIEKGDYNLKVVGDCVGEQRHAFPFTKGVDKEFLEAFDEALVEMKEDGFMTELYLKYIGVDVSKPVLEETKAKTKSNAKKAQEESSESEATEDEGEDSKED